tara:strand:+ start:41571 stop:42074 length:504 start_codon:yes stop_codon:yes gene_type:complete
MQLKEFICKSCDSKSTNGSSFHKLCFKCNNKRLDNSNTKSNITKTVKKPRSYKCKDCGCQTSQGNSFHKLCLRCNQSRLDNKLKSRVKKKPKVYRKKVTGEREMFSLIWDTRPHICTNCEESLGSEARVHYFSHIKPKGKYPELRLDPNNIKLLCIECHRKADFGGI